MQAVLPHSFLLSFLCVFCGSQSVFAHRSQVFGTPRNITIPPTAFSDGKGTVSFPVPLAQSANFIMTMSDSTGWNTGGTTKLLTVGASKGGNCNSTMPGAHQTSRLSRVPNAMQPSTFISSQMTPFSSAGAPAHILLWHSAHVASEDSHSAAMTARHNRSPSTYVSDVAHYSTFS